MWKHTDADPVSSKTDRRLTRWHCILAGGNLVSLNTKKQPVIMWSSVEVEHRAMTYGSCEVLWLILLQELGFKKSGPTFSYCESTSTLHIINNSVYHGITKYIEVDWNSSEKALWRKKYSWIILIQRGSDCKLSHRGSDQGTVVWCFVTQLWGCREEGADF